VCCLSSCYTCKYNSNFIFVKIKTWNEFRFFIISPKWQMTCMLFVD
jgi:hypothetical protein